VTIGTPWAFWGGLAAVAAGLAALWFAIAHDWARTRARRRRCPRCWYDMTATPGLTCPECGRTARHESRLHRSRRRWTRAALATLILLAGSAGLFNDRLARIDWVRATPSWLLVRIVKDPTLPSLPGVQSPPSPDRWKTELWSRYADGGLSHAQRTVVLSKLFTEKLPPVQFRCRASWPVGVPLQVQVIERFDGPLPREFRARADLPGAPDIVAYLDGDTGYWRRSRTAAFQTVGTPVASAANITLNGTISEGGRVVWRGPLALPVAVKAALSDVIQGVRDATLDAFVRELATSIRLRGVALSVVIPPASAPVSRTAESARARTAIALRLELLRDGRAVTAVSVLVPAAPTDPWASGVGEVWYPLPGASAPDADGLTLRIRPDVPLALRSFDFDQYWEGEITIPLGADRRSPDPLRAP
jgi:hypothetical protein